jgi:hypothetical protein
VHSGRGKKLFEADVLPMWSRYVGRGAVRYLPSWEHPLIASFLENLTEQKVRQLKSILEAIGSSIPVEAIYSDYSVSPKDLDVSVAENDEVLIEKISQIRAILDPQKSMEKDHFARVIRSTRLLEGAEDILAIFLKREF